jgi:hypothetical protein
MFNNNIDINPFIQFDTINVNLIEKSSGIFIGKNRQCNWSSYNKSNLALGSISGRNNLVKHNLNIVMDNDTIDTHIDYQLTKL